MKYLKFITLTSAAFLLLATSCRENENEQPVFDPPVVAITNETPMVVNIANEELPYIQGQITTEGTLTNVRILIASGASHQVISTITEFENPQNFAINIRPNYSLEMTGIRVSATDAQNQTTTTDFAFRVVNEPDFPVIAFANDEGMIINLTDTDNPPPHIQGAVTSIGNLTNVTIYTLFGEEPKQQVYEHTDFDNPQHFPIHFLPDYTLEMTGVRVIATNARNRTATLDLPFRVIDDVLPPAINFTSEEGVIFLAIAAGNSPFIQGTVTTDGTLERVRIYTVSGNATQFFEEHTTFSNPNRFDINVRPNYTPQMTGLRVEATDASSQMTTTDFHFDFPDPTDYTPASGNRLAFPTAEGAGRYTVGGRNGRVLVVTNLNNSGEGSFRWAVEQTGARTIIFDVAGEINLTSRLNINHNNVTIAGQSAPGDGITIRGQRFVLNNANQVIVRFLRIRPGIANDGDAFEGQQRSNVILDHLSMSWADDEVASFYNNRYFTMQWSIISEPFGAGANRGMGGLMGGHTATFANNLFAHTRSRNPRFNGARLSGRNPDLEMADFVNNVMYNFATSPNGGELGRYNFQNNFFRPGPATPTGTVRNRFLNLYARNESSSVPEFRDLGWFFMTGNVMEGNAALTNSNWDNVALQSDPRSRGNTVNDVRVNTPFMSEWAINMRTAQQAFDVVLERAGASFRRDNVDTRVVGEVRAGNATFGTGLVPGDVVPGSWHVHDVTAQPAPRHLRGTANDDGIPDWFKLQHRLPLNRNMANRHSLSPYYTNLEMYLNYIVEHIHN